MRLNNQLGFDRSSKLREIPHNLFLPLHRLLVFIRPIGYFLRRGKEGVEEPEVDSRDPYCARSLEGSTEDTTGHTSLAKCNTKRRWLRTSAAHLGIPVVVDKLAVVLATSAAAGHPLP
jgi:hypothetical protein